MLEPKHLQLWLSLGKTMAEKAAWRAARGTDLKLVTICPALVTGPGFRRRNPTPSIAYLKGPLLSTTILTGQINSVTVGANRGCHPPSFPKAQ